MRVATCGLGFDPLFRRVSTVAVVLLFLLAGFARTAQADVAKAKAHYERGLALYQVGEYRQALEEFKAAHLEKPDPAFLYNMGQCFRQLGERESALTFYKRYLSLAPDSPLRDDVQRRIHELESAGTGQPGKAVPPPIPVAPTSSRPRIVMEPTTSTEPSTSRIVSKPISSPPTALPRWLPWAAAGVTIALAVSATLSGLSASSRFDELRNSCGQTAPGCTTAQIDSVKGRALAANILWALTGLAAVGTGVTVYANTREAGLGGLWRF